MKELLLQLADAQKELAAAPQSLRGYWEVVIDSIDWNLTRLGGNA
jgi:hypothetical protein